MSRYTLPLLGKNNRTLGGLGILGGMEKDGAEGIHEGTWLKVEDTVIVELEEVSASNETDWEIVDADDKLSASCVIAIDVFWKHQRS